MRSFIFILTVGFVLVGPSLAGSPETSRQGIGTFSYSGSPVNSGAPNLTVIAAR